MKKLAVLFPGIGYTVHKPLLYYSARIAAGLGYEIRPLPYTGFPQKVKGDRKKMEESCKIARKQARQMLSDLKPEAFDSLLFIGKSIGTVVAAEFAAEYESDRIALLLYTPLEETFRFPLGRALVFTGSGDPWVGKEASRIPELCQQKDIPCFVIPDANHSLETDDPQRDLLQLQKIMDETERFIRAVNEI